MSEDERGTEELRKAQSQREAEEQALARAAGEEETTATHQRRAEKARYLQEKLAERAESERQATGAGGSPDEEASGSGTNE